jgi:two-component system, NarL family, invasion response regulator UvrY
MITIFIADDHRMVRDGLKSIISKNIDLSIVGEASDGYETLRKIRDIKADVLLLDVSMPGPGFLELIKHITAMDKTTRPGKILVLTAHSEEQYAMRAFKAGADGYLTKEHSPEELNKAIHKLHEGGKYVSQSMAEKMIDIALDPNKENENLSQQLSDREYQILCMLGKGISPKDISANISLSSKTVSTYRARLMKKMGMKSNADIIRYVIENNLD